MCKQGLFFYVNLLYMALVDLKKIESSLEATSKDLINLSIKEQVGYLKHGTDKIINLPELEKKLTESKKSGRPLRVKFGIDPTTTDIHLGHAVPLLLLRKFQDLGHQVMLIFGDFTAGVGDPSHRVKERPVLTPEEIKENVKTYKKQSAKVLDVEKADVHLNSEWLKEISLSKFFGYLGLQTVAAGFEREDFRKRKSVTRAELLYATLQALDSIELKADIEIGGADQLLNFIEARELMKKVNLPPQSIMTTPLLLGLSGEKKMSKSLKNYIGLLEPADQIYAKIMSIPDSHMEQYFRLLTNLTVADWKAIAAALKKNEVHPMEVKKLLARRVTFLLCPSKRLVAKAEQAFENVFSDKKAPKKIPSLKLSPGQAKDLAAVVLAAKAAPSRSEAKRLVKGGAVNLVEGSKRSVLKELGAEHKKADLILQIGKHKFVKVIWQK